MANVQRRVEIARALRRLMASQGYERTSIADVAEAAGLAPGLIHYHFKNKLEILLSVQEHLGASHLARVDEALAGETSPESQLEAFLDVHLALDRANPEALACWVTLGGEALRQSAVRTGYQALMARLRERLQAVLERGVADGRFRCDPASASSALLALIQGYFVLAATCPEQIPRGSAAPNARAMALGLVAP